ncbi:MAG: DegT/DnrJ/EryC1/StrS family aminotransferase [bacterium]|nr:DegT/DnrJ/EryC1/StrS family aminotransferase [bacterium]MDZ4286205.1 DegT/DnrJ/EryC1/StrS family aminotransferase [Candidatus Sungbacteria bacterium]
MEHTSRIKKAQQQLGVGTGDLGALERRLVMDVLKKQRLSYGPYSRQFEETFARLHDCNFGLFVNSGTSALRIAVAALKEAEDWEDNDEILCPAVTFVASANVIIMNGLSPVFVDVDPNTYNIDPAKIEARITPRTKAIMVVHLFGQPADMDPIIKIARKHKLRIIEDSCETMFARYKGKVVGSFGDISCFSTYIAHVMVTGVGGLSCTNNRKYATIMRSLANHGRDGIYMNIDDDKNLESKQLVQVVSRRFNFVRMGYSFRATEMEAALGIAQLTRKDAIIAARQRNARYLIKGLRDLEHSLQLPSWPSYSDHIFMVFPLVIRQGSGIRKKDMVMFLEEHNIETRDLVPLINQPIYRTLYGNQNSRYPIAHWINQNGFYIGCHQKMSRHDLDYIISAFHAFFEKKSNAASNNLRKS